MMTNSDEESNTEENLVIIDYHDLQKQPNDISTAKELHPLLHKAFGFSSSSSSSSTSSSSSSSSYSKNHDGNSALGVIVIRNIPSFVETKNSFLPLAHKLATLPQDYLDTNLTDAKSMYNTGWSHGKEKLKNNIPDYAKGSYYFNPITDSPGTEEERDKYPASYPKNKWPDESHIPQFEHLGKRLGVIMKDVVALLASHIDSYVLSQCKDYNASIGMEMKHTEKVKGRLLYYFPQLGLDEHNKEQKQGDTMQDSWIGWHNDSGFLTALAGDMYVDHETGDTIPKDDIDPKAGLYIMDRTGKVTQVNIPDDCMAVQIGECFQIVTGGNVVATPHCVKSADPNWYRKEDNVDVDGENKTKEDGKKSRKIARISFPCFVDTVPTFPLTAPNGCSREEVLKRGVVGCAKVPPLENRWLEDGMDFGSFLQTTFALYYNWS
mmetsp:Transcript_26205/g.32300  ORF Transcript_26205/g.32300 Transcript_26205/m.32300 type:complete len:435 (-) Transcript_26205:123-1427(-)